MELYLKSLDFKFSLIGLTETWLDVDKEKFYDLNGYTSVNRYRKDKKGGGVSLHILQGITFTLRNDLDYFDSEMETVFIEIDKSVYNTCSNIVIGVIYRMLNSSVDTFNERISDILNVIQKEHKLCYLLGDLNIDFLKADEHRATGELLDCPACRTTFIATRFRVAVICPIIPVPHCIRVFFYFVWFVFINHIFQFYYELCTYCNILDIYLS